MSHGPCGTRKQRYAGGARFGLGLPSAPLCLALVSAWIAVEPAAGRAEAAPPSPRVVVPPEPPKRVVDARAQEAAARAYEEADKYSEEGKYEEAARAARRVFEAAPTASTAIIYATALEFAGRRSDALAMLLVARDLAVDDRLRRKVEEQLAAIAGTVGPGYGWIRLEVQPAGAHAVIAGHPVPVGRTLGVEEGVWTLRVTRPGYVTFVEPLRVEAGKGRTVEVVLEARKRVHPDRIVLVPSVPPPRPLDPRTREEASRALEEARAHVRAGRFDAALRAARRAFEAAPTAASAVVYAEALAEVGNPYAALSKLLVARDLAPTPQARRQVEEEFAKVASSLFDPGFGWVRLEVQPPGAEAMLAGYPVPIGRTVGVQAGSWDLRIVHAGHVTIEEVLHVEAGAGRTVKVTLAPARPRGVAGAGTMPGAGTKHRPTPPHPNAESHGERVPEPSVRRKAAVRSSGSSRTGAWILVGSGIALVGGGVGMTLWARSAVQTANRWAAPDAAYSTAQRKARYDEATTAAKRRALGSYILYGAGAAALVGGIVWAALPAHRVGASSAWGLSPWFDGGSAGLALHWAY